MQDESLDMHFPLVGVDVSQAFWRQPVRPLPDGTYSKTCRVGNNVRAVDTSNRGRGGNRPGMVRYIATPVVADWIIQELQLIVWTGGAVVQTSQLGRVVTVLAVSQGLAYTAAAGATVWSSTINNTGNNPPLNFSGLMFSTALNQKLWFADGINWVYYNPTNNSVNTWAATAGSLPVDSDGNTPRLICTWRGRIVLSGLLKDSQNWFMSRVDAPTDFDYSPLSTTPTQAVAGNNAPIGIVGDVVTSLCPYTDDILVFFGDHTIWMLRGDPMAGGQLDLISDSIGGVWGVCWCKDPYGNIYFVSNRTGIYTLVPGQQPQRISQPIEFLLSEIDTGANTIRLIWDDRYQGLHVFVTLTAAPAPTTHFFYETRTGAWWTDTFFNVNHNPLCCVVFDGNLPGDRVPLIGSWDGYVRAISPTATTDDGFPIQSSVVLGPIVTKDLDEMILKSLQAVLGKDSGDVTFSVYLGTSAEEALETVPVMTGIWSAGRNLTNLIRSAAHGIYVKITSSNPWALEGIRAILASQGGKPGTGKVRQRGY